MFYTLEKFITRIIFIPNCHIPCLVYCETEIKMEKINPYAANLN